MTMAKKPKEEMTIETAKVIVEAAKDDTPDEATIDNLVNQHSEQSNEETNTNVDTPIEPRKRGRPKGSKNRPRDLAGKPISNVQDIIPRPVCKAIIALPYSLAARYYGPHWELSDTEAESMIDCHMALAAKYLPAYLKDNIELYTVALMHGMIVFAKMELHYKLKRENPQTINPAVGTNAGDNPISRENGMREEFSRFGIHQSET